MLVFVKRKVDADRLARAVTRGAAPATSIHSDRRQEDRIAALEAFRRGEYPVLVATDVAARGIDVEGISHVVNFDVPFSPDDYIHRGGRTARAGAVGEVLTFVAPEEEDELLCHREGDRRDAAAGDPAELRSRRARARAASGPCRRARPTRRQGRAPAARQPGPRQAFDRHGNRRRDRRLVGERRGRRIPRRDHERRGGRCRSREAPPAAPAPAAPDPRPRYPPNESDDGALRAVVRRRRSRRRPRRRRA